MKFLRKSLAIFLLLTMVFTIAACSSDEETKTETTTKTEDTKKEETKKEEPADDEIVIGLSLPTQQEERWVRDKEKMEAAAEEAGVKLLVQVANNDVAQQDAQAKNLIAQGIDVLILAPQDAAAAASIVEAASEEGIPVISYDRLITNTDKLDYYLSFDNVRVGELQGAYITDLVSEGNYIIMSGAPTDNNAKLFKEGAMTYLQPLIDEGKVNVIVDQPVDDWKPENALKIIENALTKANNDVQAILAPNDGTAGGAIQALAAQGLDGQVPITGQDAELAAAQRIVEGTQSMTIFKDTRMLGAEAINIAIALANGEEVKTNGAVSNNSVDVPSVLLTPYVVDKDNIDELLIESGYLKKEDVYK
ncbi:sugar ABC transporter substrate-binding protein [Vallitalea okinawensis]|uniref:sugar ABC transporter substrate-binding protein n=1 Tax=Vallitalea okinawensis TaxID=2078660 RepID=UPI000CFA847E|nr:substrate-binding domain-containing protein [Vallitalea okinawensis]